MKKRGFTLIELLVVIAIIAILAAMIMPVLVEAKDAARMRRCVGNLKQLGTAIFLYMDDHNDFGLPIDKTMGRHSNDNTWVLFMRPLRNYVGQAIIEPRPTTLTGYQPPNVIWVCSGDFVRGNVQDDNNKPCWWHWGSSYMYPGPTAYVSAPPDDPEAAMSKDPACLPQKPRMWRSPKQDMLLSDYWFDFHSGYKVEKNVRQPEIRWLNRPSTDVKRINVLFLDGHAAAVTPAERDVLIDYLQLPIALGGDNPCVQP